MSTNTKTKTTTKATISALSNPFSTGGGGVDFEHRVQATFLLALLVKSFTPLLNAPITSVRFQGKRGGNDIDDVIVESCLDAHSAKLLCQIKHGVSLTKNETFKEVLISAWSDYNKASFNKQNDKIVLISGAVANANSLRFIYDQATVAIDAEDFVDRINRENYSNDTNRKKLQIIRDYLKEANNNQDVTNEQLWGFCKVFTILVFDLDYESSVNEFLIRALIASNCKDDALSTWSQLVDCAAKFDKEAAHITLNKIPDFIKQKFTNIISIKDDTVESIDFTVDSFWAKLALIGSWREKNNSDKKFLESFLGKTYHEVQKIIQEDSLQPNPNISFSEGLWHINHRRSIIKVSSKLS